MSGDVRGPDPDSVVGGEAMGKPSARDLASGVATVFGNTTAVGRELARLGYDLGQVALGRSSLAPARGDRRFTDPAWEQNPLFHRVEQAYLASAGALNRLADVAIAGGLEPKQAEQARFTIGLINSALAPTNFLATNPAALKEAFTTGGGSLLRGARHFLDDVRHNGGMPRMVDSRGFVVGGNLAVTPGAVVDRDPVAEILQYDATTERVHNRPLLIVPPPIGRFYFLDLAPGRSFVEYAVSRGVPVFILSWRNPTADQADWDLDTYASRVDRAIDAVLAVAGADDLNLMGFCAGGIIATTTLNHLAANGDKRVHSMSYAVTLLDFGEASPISAFSNRRVIGFARRKSQRVGIISSRDMGAAFAWMRPDDLVFNYLVNNYLLGKSPPAFDILAWNADGTNLPGALHAQFLDIFRDNLLSEPGALSVLGTPVDIGQINVPNFVTGALTDHLTPWTGCYRTTQVLGGESTFVLSYSGHIASLVNPPGNPKAHYWTGPTPGPDPLAWKTNATQRQGSWWEPWAEWITEHSGGDRPAPERPGSKSHPVLGPAPGLYVRDLTA